MGYSVRGRTYFAEDARYSAKYSYAVRPAGNHQLLLAQVLVGEPYEMRPWKGLQGVPVMPPVLPFVDEPRQEDYNATTGAGGGAAGCGVGSGAVSVAMSVSTGGVCFDRAHSWLLFAGASARTLGCDFKLWNSG
jgi:hypothetical protein